ncbi:MAG: hypothetical protein WC838_00065 [Candidatus Margulisiibacteriota bacterium]|jgi:hypothetical protein
MKKSLIIVSFLLILFCLPSFALFSVGALGSSYSFTGASVTAMGVEVGLPVALLPLASTRVQVLTGTYSGATFMPIMVQQSYSLPFVGLYGGLEAGYISAKISGVSGGVLSYGGFVGYEMPLGFGSGFAEVSFDVIPFSSIVSTAKDESVMVLKTGARIGI